MSAFAHLFTPESSCILNIYQASNLLGDPAPLMPPVMGNNSCAQGASLKMVAATAKAQAMSQLVSGGAREVEIATESTSSRAESASSLSVAHASRVSSNGQVCNILASNLVAQNL